MVPNLGQALSRGRKHFQVRCEYGQEAYRTGRTLGLVRSPEYEVPRTWYLLGEGFATLREAGLKTA